MGTMTVEAVTFIENIGDPYGSGALVGGPRVDVNTNAGAGLLQVENEVLKEFEQKTRSGGVQVVLAGKSASRVIEVSGNRPLVYRSIVLEAFLTGYGDYFLPPLSGLGLANAGGTVTITWTRPVGYASRFDWIGATVRRKLVSAPTSVTDGTAVASGVTGASTTDAPGSGTWFYAAFSEWDEDEDGTAESYGTGISSSVAV